MPDPAFDLVAAQDRFLDSDWFHHCRETSKPFVVVRSGELAADVFWDYITLPPRCDELLNRALPDLEREARAIFERYAVPSSFLRVKPTMIAFDHLPFEHAKHAATELYRLIASYLERSSQEQARTAPADHPGAAQRHDDKETPMPVLTTPRRLWT